MAKISDIKERVTKLDVSEVIENAIIDTQKDLVKYQKEQMLHGVRKSGKKIGKYKSPAYAKKKFQMNSKAGLGNKDLKLTGDFHSRVLVDVRGKEVIVSSDDPKTEKIVEREGDDIFGLSKEFAKQYSNNELAEAAIVRFKNQLSK